MKRWCTTAYIYIGLIYIYRNRIDHQPSTPPAWQPQLVGTPGEDEGLQSFGFNEKSGRIEMMVVMAPDA